MWGRYTGGAGFEAVQGFFSVTWYLIGINFREQAGSGPWWLVEVVCTLGQLQAAEEAWVAARGPHLSSSGRRI